MRRLYRYGHFRRARSESDDGEPGHEGRNAKWQRQLGRAPHQKLCADHQQDQPEYEPDEVPARLLS